MTTSTSSSTQNISVGIIFGGKSAEHEVSLRSALNIINAIDTNRYKPVLIAVEKSGRWFLVDASSVVAHSDDPSRISLNLENAKQVVLAPQSEGSLVSLETQEVVAKIDVAFPVLHGTFGEDGTVQGLLKLANIPFVGASVLGSAVGMDKDVMKRLLRDAKIPIGKFLTHTAKDLPSIEEIEKSLGLPFFVKPANMGSSVGVSKVSETSQFEDAVRNAFLYDSKILLEENIVGREIECSVLGNEDPVASVLGEVIPHHDFYSYEAKYLDENGAGLEVPAKLSEVDAQRLQALAIKTFQALCCEGLGRVDFFYTDSGEVFVNEINTIPGFTSISMYPRLWEASGVSYTELIHRLITFAIQRFERERQLKTDFTALD